MKHIKGLFLGSLILVPILGGPRTVISKSTSRSISSRGSRSTSTSMSMCKFFLTNNFFWPKEYFLPKYFYQDIIINKSLLKTQVINNLFLKQTQKDAFLKIYSKAIKYFKTLNFSRDSLRTLRSFS